MIDQAYLHKILRALVHDLKGSLGTSAGLAKLLKDKYHHKLEDKGAKWLDMIALEYATCQSKLTGLSAYTQLVDYSPKITRFDLANFIDSWQSAFEYGRLNTLTSVQHYQLVIDEQSATHSNEDYPGDTYLLGLFLDELMANAISHADPRKHEANGSTIDETPPHTSTLKCHLSYARSESDYSICFKDNGRNLLESELDFIKAPFTSLQHSFTKSLTPAKTAGIGFARLFRIAELLDANLQVSIGDSHYPGLQVRLYKEL